MKLSVVRPVAVKVVVLVLLVLALALGYALLARSMPPLQVSVAPQFLTQPQHTYLTNKLNSEVSEHFFNADLTALAKSLHDEPWVSEVRVTKDWPDQLHVEVLPRTSVARFGSTHLIDDHANLYTAPTWVEASSNSVRFYGDPLKVAAMTEQYALVNQWFAPTGQRLVEVQASKQGDWLFLFDSGLKVLAPSQLLGSRMGELAALLSGPLKSKSELIGAVDLRYDNGFAVRWKNAQKPQFNSAALTQSGLATSAGSQGGST